MSIGETETLIALELEKALAKPGPFLILPAGLRLTDGARQAFAAAAEQHGRKLGLAPYNRAVEAAARHSQSDTPTIPSGDSKKFLANLKEIAAGRVRVE